MGYTTAYTVYHTRNETISFEIDLFGVESIMEIW